MRVVFFIMARAAHQVALAHIKDGRRADAVVIVLVAERVAV